MPAYEGTGLGGGVVLVEVVAPPLFNGPSSDIGGGGVRACLRGGAFVDRALDSVVILVAAVAGLWWAGLVSGARGGALIELLYPILCEIGARRGVVEFLD